MTEKPGYRRIAMATAQALADADAAADVAVYLPSPSKNAPTLYCQGPEGLSKAAFERLRNNGVAYLYVANCDHRRYETLLEAKLSILLDSPKLSKREKARLARQVATGVARDITQEPITPEGLTRACKVVDSVLGCVLADPAVASIILNMAQRERGTAGHMFVVSALAIMLGREVYGSDRRILMDLGMAGMMHDIGKLAINPSLLSKPEPLTFEEVRLIQQHPIESVRLLGDDPHATPPVRQMILQHHERLDGRGYPIGISEEELLPLSRILSIVDSFHALIGDRPYRRPLTPVEANRVLSKQAGTQFDADLLVYWQALFERYHLPGPFVVLSDAGKEPEEEVSSHHEHRPTPPRARFGARPRRFSCGGNVAVKCVYAGRLHDATCAPDEFMASLHDVSRGGLCLLSAYPMYRGEIVHVQFDHTPEPSWVRGMVAWCRRQDGPSYKIGLRLVQRLTEAEAAGQVPLEGIPPRDNAPGPPSTGARDPARKTIRASRPSDPCPRKDDLDALAAIATMRPPDLEAERTAVTLSTSADPAVRRKAAEALAGLGTMTARRALMALLRDDDSAVREHAVTVAGTLEMHEASHQFRALLDDPVETVALRAAGALGRLGDQSGLDLAKEALERDGPHTRLAARAFGEIVGHRFPANPQGVEAARRYLTAGKGEKPALRARPLRGGSERRPRGERPVGIPKRRR